MKLHGSIKINNKQYEAGDEVPWHAVYPFFMLHMLAFGGSGFVMAYATPNASALFLYLHGGFAVLIYTLFYFTIFGRDEVKWMFINAFLGFLGIYTQMGWILALFDKNISSYPLHIHVIPFLYFVLYTFLLRQAVIDLTHSREDEARLKRVDYGFSGILAGSYILSYLAL